MTLGFPKHQTYEDSGVDWIGDVPRHWATFKLKHLVEVVNGSTPYSGESSFWDGDIVWITPNDLGKNRSKYVDSSERRITDYGLQNCGAQLTPPGSVILSTRAPIGYVAITAGETCTNQGCKTLVIRNQSTLPSFLYYSLIASTGFLNALGRGTTFVELSTGDLKSVPVVVPPLEEQTRIAAFLDEKTAEIDDAIAKKQRLIELLQEQKAILINRAVTQGLDPNVSMRDSGVAWIGQVPAHWEVISSKWMFAHRKERFRLGDQQLTASQEFGVIPQQEYMEKTGYRVMQVTLNAEILKHVEIDDFVISMRSFQGGLERAKASGCISSAYVVLEPSPQANVDYFAYLFKSVRYIEALRSTSNLVRDGQALRYDNFCMVPLPVIPSNEQEEIAAFLDQATSQADTLCKKIQKEIDLLKEFRTILISDAVTGKIKV